VAAGVRGVRGGRKLGVRLDNWLTAEQGQALWQAPDRERLKGKRDRALLALLLACGLRRHEAVALTMDHLQQREEHWAIGDLMGKGGHVRTVPVPDWVKSELGVWLGAAGINRGRLFRRVNKVGKAWGASMTVKAVWHIVKESAKCIGVPKLAPLDLRRTCARLCHASGGELEQIQFLLGHVSVQTTERYLGCKQRIRSAVNDRVGSSRILDVTEPVVEGLPTIRKVATLLNRAFIEEFQDTRPLAHLIFLAWISCPSQR
jgi:integrase